MAAVDDVGGGRPRWLRILLLVVAGGVLTSFFMYLRFPYDQLASSLGDRLEQVSGVRVDIVELSPSLQWLGPGIEASGVRATWPDGSVVNLDRVTIRPAWSLSWLMLEPAFATRVESPLFDADGTLTLGDPRRFKGELTEVDLALVPAEDFAPGSELAGLADVELELRFSPNGPEGPLTFVARD